MHCFCVVAVCWLCGLAGDRPPREKANRLLENLTRLSEASRLGWEGPLRIVQPHTDTDVDDLQLEDIDLSREEAGRSLADGDGLGGDLEPEPEPEEMIMGLAGAGAVR
jgi:hypothetical protein